MDMVTIWLQRVAGRPVQVFTGYLDEVPYYQGYPQNAVFKATCTLKKLAYTWFDPGLQTFWTWLTSQGWIFDPSSGEASLANASAEAAGTSATSAAASAAADANDTGFASLLGRFMTDIAGWASEDVLVSELHQDLPKIASQLYNLINQDTKTDLDALNKYFAATMGVSGFSVDPSTPTDSNNSPVIPPAKVALIAKIKAVADNNNIPLLVLVFAAFLLTNLDEKYDQDPDTGNTNWGYGIFALQPVVSTVFSTPTLFTDPIAALTPDIDGKKPSDLLDATVSAQVFCKRLNANQGSWATAARSGDVNGIVTWVQKALGRKLPNVDLTAAVSQAKTLTLSGTVVTPPTSSPSLSTNQGGWSDPNFLSNMLPADKVMIQTFYLTQAPWLTEIATKVLLTLGGATGQIKLARPPGVNGTEIAFTGPTDMLQQVFNAYKGNASVDSISLGIAGGDNRSGNDSQSLKKGVVSNVPTPGTVKSNLLVFTQSAPATSSTTTPSAASGTNTDSGSSTNGAASATFSQLASFSANAAFAANFAFPTDTAEANLLTGNRALMNDISCLDGVKQFCQSSLRTFRSLPDGRFLAFYPDYFGSYRKPYWQIYNIELEDFGIQLNDEQLATHVYVIGDTIAGSGADVQMVNDIMTRGVATITQAFMLNSFIEQYDGPTNSHETGDQPAIGRLKDSYAFLQHYGARPFKEEQPLIRNVFYEFLMAWQKFMYLWATQFATAITFTFQPEVMAGGLIAFPDHGIQMYCEEVTHTWDYASGFTTQATMTAPSLLKTATAAQRGELPGFALGGNINTVGVDA